MLLASCYALAGVIQAASLFVGSEAIQEANFRGAVALVTFVIAGACFWAATGFKRMPPRPALILAGSLMLVLATAMIWYLPAEHLAVDSCLDYGGSYDYIVGACDLIESHPYLPILHRHGFRIAGFAVFLLLGLAAFAALHRNPSGRDAG